MNCWQERFFYYWRHGLYGHCVSLCNTLAEENKNDLFLPLWATLAKVKQNVFQNQITFLLDSANIRLHFNNRIRKNTTEKRQPK